MQCAAISTLYKRNTNSTLNAWHQNFPERKKQNEMEIKALVHGQYNTFGASRKLMI